MCCSLTRKIGGVLCVVKADEVTTDKHACDRVNEVSHVWEARSELNH